MVLENFNHARADVSTGLILQTRIKEPTQEKQAMQHMHYISRNNAKQLQSEWIHACDMQQVCKRVHLSKTTSCAYRSAHKTKLNEQNWFSPSCACLSRCRGNSFG